MKHKQKMTAVLMAAALAAAIAIPAFAVRVMTINVEPDVKVYVDDMPIDAGDTHGNPEAFIYNGTTYIAAKAVSNSLGQNVSWDGVNRRVYIGSHYGSSLNLLDVCPPYQRESLEMPDTVSLAGKKYDNCLYLKVNSPFLDQEFGKALFNLDGKYNTLTFVAGHRDGASMGVGRYKIYLDGELVLTVGMNGESMPQEHSVDLNGAKQLKITAMLNGSGYALANLKVR